MCGRTKLKRRVRGVLRWRQSVAERSCVSVSVEIPKRLVLRKQFFKLFGAAFHVYDEAGNLVFYSKQKAFRLKEDIRLYESEAMQRELLVIQARQVLDFAAAYDVWDPTRQERVGALRRRGFHSFVQDKWVILDAQDREIGSVTEDSLLLGMIRRLFLSLIPQTFRGEVGGIRVFSLRQHFNPIVLKLTLEFEDEAPALLDRRLGLAAAVLVAAIEGRQD